MLHTRVLPGALVLALLSLAAQGQVEHGGRPPSLRRALRQPLRTAVMEPVRSDLLLAEDAAGAGKGALRFAEILPVELGLANAGTWEELGGGDRLWRLRIHSTGAKSLALVFSRYHLPPGGELYAYDDARKVVRGAFTEYENRLDGEFAIRPLRGASVTLEYFEPAAVRGQGELVLASVAHDYLDVLSRIEPDDRTGGGNTSDPCEIDVACNLGTPWPNQINAAVHIESLANGFLCSGSLLTNTAGDGTVLVLTAAHCGSLTSAVFTFNFERPGCRTGVAPCTNQVFGATELVRNDDLDVQLLRLNVPQGPLGFPVHLAGWDRSDVPPAALFLIHHPQGDVKKISRDNNAPSISNNFWRIPDWDRGVSEPGSSGAPAFAGGSGLFLGILDSGASSCINPFDDDFATRLAAAWPLVGPYLDPIGTGQLTTTGLDLANVTAAPFDVTGVFPPVVPTIDPAPGRNLRILGAGFTDATLVFLDGQPLASDLYLRGGHSFLNVDLPPLVAGTHDLTVTENGVSKSVSFDTAPPTVPVTQVNRGPVDERVYSADGVDLFYADQPNHRHLCLWSLSNVPSVFPFVSLGIGNGGTDLRDCFIVSIAAGGLTQRHQSLAPGLLPIGTPIYSQTICLTHRQGMPWPVSSVQRNLFQF